MPDTLAQRTAILPERLTLEQAVPMLAQLMPSLMSQPGPQVVLDASALREFDTSAVAVLLEWRRVLRPQGKTLLVQHAPQRLRDLVALYGVQELLSV
ncbi:MAG: anti-anti-sigma factor [Polaromonas sp.]|nr:anti-anti-sigma factor [Polaromonas sp.]